MNADRRCRADAVPARRWIARSALFVLLAATSGCRILADELIWLDRIGPSAAEVEAPVSGLTPGS